MTAEGEFEKSLSATVGWFRSWHVTGSKRHLDAALICAKITRERFVAVQQKRRSDAENRQLIAIEREAEREATITEIREAIASCRLALADMMGKARGEPPPDQEAAA